MTTGWAYHGDQAAFGDYFAPAVLRSGDPRRPFTDALVDPSVVDGLVTGTRQAFAERAGRPVEAVEARAAASVWFLGLAARLVSPPFGAAVLSGAAPGLRADRLFLTPAGGLAVEDATAVDVLDGRAVADVLVEDLLDGIVAPLLATVSATCSLSPVVLWGNVASALMGAVIVVRSVRPALAGTAAALAADLLARAPLAGTGTVHDDGRFRRASCCLYYRLPGGGLCGDCVIRTSTR